MKTERDYDFTYKQSKKAKEEKEGNLEIVLERYIESYSWELIHLDDYSKNIVLDHIYPYKEEFVTEAISKQFGDVFVSVSELRGLVDLIDTDVNELNTELEDDTDDDF